MDQMPNALPPGPHSSPLPGTISPLSQRVTSDSATIIPLRRKNASVPPPAIEPWVDIVNRLQAQCPNFGFTVQDLHALSPIGLAALKSTLHRMEELEKALNATQKHIRTLERLADTDPLLRIANRRNFLNHLVQTLSLVSRYHTPASLIYIDLDELKSINDRHGHLVGDRALFHLVRVVKARLRASDIVGRLGGDEIGIILPQTSLADAEGIAHMLSLKLEEEPFSWQGVDISLSISYGLADLAKHKKAASALLAADQAMYRHKQSRKLHRPCLAIDKSARE